MCTHNFMNFRTIERVFARCSARNSCAYNAHFIAIHKHNTSRITSGLFPATDFTRRARRRYSSFALFAFDSEARARERGSWVLTGNGGEVPSTFCFLIRERNARTWNTVYLSRWSLTTVTRTRENITWNKNSNKLETKREIVSACFTIFCGKKKRWEYITILIMATCN